MGINLELNETLLDNELVRQKDYILRLANNGQIREAAKLLSFVAGVWNATGYGYKVREIRDRLYQC